MSLLLETLGNNEVDRKVKPQILAVFGDMALAIGPEFKKYLELVIGMLHQASQAQVNRVIEILNDFYICVPNVRLFAE
jgi:importin subunit beta-1